MLNIHKIYILAPDEAAGQDFRNVLERYSISPGLIYHRISPRVLGGVLNSNFQEIGYQLCEGITKIININNEIGSGKPIITISCNTLSLPVFVNKSLELLTQNGLFEHRDFELITTLDAVKNKFDKLDKALFIGTRAISENLDKKSIKTLLNDDKRVVKSDGTYGEAHEFDTNTVSLEGVSFEAENPTSGLVDILYKRNIRGDKLKAKHEQDITNLRLITDDDEVERRLGELSKK